MYDVSTDILHVGYTKLSFVGVPETTTLQIAEAYSWICLTVTRLHVISLH